MKTENWAWLTAIVALVCITVIIVCSINAYSKRLTSMMENGYEETAYPGSRGTYWHKVK